MSSYVKWGLKTFWLCKTASCMWTLEQMRIPTARPAKPREREVPREIARPTKSQSSDLLAAPQHKSLKLTKHILEQKISHVTIIKTFNFETKPGILKNIQRFSHHWKHRNHNGPCKIGHGSVTGHAAAQPDGRDDRATQLNTQPEDIDFPANTILSIHAIAKCSRNSQSSIEDMEPQMEP